MSRFESNLIALKVSEWLNKTKELFHKAGFDFNCVRAWEGRLYGRVPPFERNSRTLTTLPGVAWIGTQEQYGDLEGILWREDPPVGPAMSIYMQERNQEFISPRLLKGYPKFIYMN